MRQAALRTMTALAGGIMLITAAGAAEPIAVKAGESLQAAIDRAPEGATLTLEPGVFAEAIVIAKPITLQGAGWDKTTIGPDQAAAISQKQKDEFFVALERTSDPQERARIAVAFATQTALPSVTVTGASGVTLSGLRVRGPLTQSDGRTLGQDTLVKIDGASATLADCALIGPFMNGVTGTNGSHLTIKGCLIAALWNTGVAAAPGTTLRLTDSDVRNCYSRCVTIGTDNAIVERCRISGSAWHGIRYDGCSPKILSNHIFANARSGIYASGRTAATVQNNVFWRNEMDAMSCWFDNADTIENNTIVGNLREGISVLGGSKPTLARNVFVGNPIAIACGKIANGRQAAAEGPMGTPKVEGNIFFKNPKPLQEASADKPLPPGNATDDPKLSTAAADFKLADDSPAKTANAGATPIAFASPFAVQQEETAMVPAADTRDYSQWKKSVAAR